MFSFAFQCGPGPKLCVFPVMEKQSLKSELMKMSRATLNLCSLGRSGSPKEKEAEPYHRDCSKVLSYLLVQTPPLLLSGSGPPTICPTCLQPTLPWGSYNCHLSFKLSLTVNPHLPCTQENLNPLEQPGVPWLQGEEKTKEGKDLQNLILARFCSSWKPFRVGLSSHPSPRVLRDFLVLLQNKPRLIEF